MKFFIFRNSTIEPLFSRFNVTFSGYNEILNFELDAEIYIWFYIHPLKVDQHKVCEEINNYQSDINYILSKLEGKKSLLVFTLTEISIIGFESFINPVKAAIQGFNNFLYEKTKDALNLKVLDFSTFTASFSPEVIVDWKYYYLSMMVINPKLSSAFEEWFNTQLNSISLSRKKCIVLDLDNTLWGGILGEDGIHNIKIGGSYPGNAFSDFQTGLLELGKKGVLLAICSKNNEADVSEIWESLPGMILKRNDFAALRINWSDKAKNLEELAVELNIGLDSFVFVDDNPAERELVKGMLPMVEVPDFPEHPYELKKFFKTLVEKHFIIYMLTQEDLVKNQQYKEIAQRVEFQKSYSNFEEYIKNLAIEISIIKANNFNISRISQMCQKTNQFNLTTKRYTDNDIRGLIDIGSLVYCMSVKDRFGDNGISGLIIININNYQEKADIDTLLLSCRILGKKIEDQFLSYMLNKILTNNFKEITASFIPTQKNMQVCDFFENQGFTIINQSNDGKKFYSLKKDDFRILTSDNYKIIEL